MILDLNLPDGDGIDTCRRIRQESDIPILMLTARDMEIDEIMGLKSGAGSTRMTGALDFILTMQRIWRKRYVRSYQMPGMCRKGNWIMLPVLLIVAVIVPVAAWHRLQKKSIVERLRENE